MPRQKGSAKNGVAIPDLKVEIGDVTSAIFPEDVPRNEDGTVASETEIPIQQAKKIGAVTAEAAKYNKDTAKKQKQKLAGQTVRWDEKDSLNLFENIKMMWSAASIYIFVSRVSPDPPINYKPFPMISLKNASDFYDYVFKNIHGKSTTARYSITFKNSAQKVGEAFLDLPDTTADMTPKGPEMYGYPPPYPYPFPPPQGPYAQQQPYYPPPGYPQAPPSAPQAPAAAAPPPAPSPMPAPQVAVEQMPVAQYQPTSQQQPNHPPGYDAYSMAMAAMQQNRELVETVRTNQLQLAQALGALEEMKRQGPMTPQMPMMPQMPLPPPQPQYTQQPQQPGISNGFPPGMPTPPGYAPTPPAPPTKKNPFPHGIPCPPGYQAVFSYVPLPGGSEVDGMPGWYFMPTGAPMYPHQQPQYQQPQQPQAPQQTFIPQPMVPQNPFAALEQSASMISGVTKTMKNLQSAVSQFGNVTNPLGTQSNDDDDDEPQENPIPTPPAVSTMPLPGGGMMAFNPDGSPNWMTTLIGNVPTITGIVKSLGETAAQIHAAQQSTLQNQQYQPPHVQQHAALPPPVYSSIVPSPNMVAQQIAQQPVPRPVPPTPTPPAPAPQQTVTAPAPTVPPAPPVTLPPPAPSFMPNFSTFRPMV